VKLTGNQQELVLKRYTDNPEAYTLYLKGRFYSYEATPESLEKSIEFYKQALKLDPNYALAYAGLADSYTELGTGTYNVYLPSQARLWAESAALNAIAIDDSLAEGHTSLGILKYRYTWDWEGAEKEFLRAIELDPKSAIAHSYYSRYLNIFGRTDEALAESRQAEELEPFVPAYSLNVARSMIFARDFDGAIAQCRKTLDLDPDYWRAYYLLGIAYGRQGRYEEAIDAFAKARNLSGDHPTAIAGLGFTYAMAGKKSEVGPILASLTRTSERRYVSPVNFALIYTFLGDKDQAFRWLEKAYEERSTALPGLAQDPLYDGLRSDPRFVEMVRRIGLSSLSASLRFPAKRSRAGPAHHDSFGGKNSAARSS
jgi:tetratricopeptide (TPR) repeat protein